MLSKAQVGTAVGASGGTQHVCVIAWQRWRSCQRCKGSYPRCTWLTLSYLFPLLFTHDRPEARTHNMHDDGSEWSTRQLTLTVCRARELYNFSSKAFDRQEASNLTRHVVLACVGKDDSLIRSLIVQLPSQVKSLRPKMRCQKVAPRCKLNLC